MFFKKIQIRVETMRFKKKKKKVKTQDFSKYSTTSVLVQWVFDHLHLSNLRGFNINFNLIITF